MPTHEFNTITEARIKVEAPSRDRARRTLRRNGLYLDFSPIPESDGSRVLAVNDEHLSILGEHPDPASLNIDYPQDTWFTYRLKKAPWGSYAVVTVPQGQEAGYIPPEIAKHPALIESAVQAIISTYERGFDRGREEGRRQLKQEIEDL